MELLAVHTAVSGAEAPNKPKFGSFPFIASFTNQGGGHRRLLPKLMAASRSIAKYGHHVRVILLTGWTRTFEIPTLLWVAQELLKVPCPNPPHTPPHSTTNLPKTQGQKNKYVHCPGILESTIDRESAEDARSGAIDAGVRDAVAPPVEHAVAVLQGKENDDGCEGDGDLEAGSQGQSVLLPPGRVAVLDVHVEDVAHDDSRAEVAVVVRREVEGASQDDGNVNVAQDAVGESPGEEVEGDGQEGAQEEAPEGGMVGTAIAEHALGADGTPDHGGREEDVGVYEWDG